MAELSPSSSVRVSARRILVLDLLAGYVDALGFVYLGGLFASAMTGNTTHLAAALVGGIWPHALMLLGILGTFFVVAMLATLARLRWQAAIGIACVGVLLGATQIAMLTPWHRTLALVLLPALMAVQGETIARFSGSAIQTIVITSNLLKCASALATSLAARWPGSTVKPPPPGAALLPGLSWLGFAAGALCGTLAMAWHVPLPFIWPLPLLVLLYLDIARAEAHNAPP
ncbi:hypothetical protein APT_00444 [Acetobacter pasteurianus NBRC 101655]|uniref:DUF1275 domain-containing protein n=1 Tax=Acetobacter pasteurianus NBRC 3188 TaxID=1226663 RepID=A0A401WQU8_ACEPA|nr:YoaK family protein [Acetobacter pasteurianus]BAU37526.1 hypothetical protein APT_00444 [Acetobacter pasteurianus NBRC 101655]GCD51693.1 hypothetical protein NBRC3188_0390 [Acetobacter pasteurianus NBRC 3188]CCT60027.1 hypothetical protein APA386B_1968 [Acetobacter pasteurianus 386B]